MSDVSFTRKRFIAGWLGTRGKRIAIILWIIVMLTFAAISIVRPGKRSVTPVYGRAAAAWLLDRTMYPGLEDEMNYLPAFAFIAWPLLLVPQGIGEALWQIAQTAIFAWALWRLGRLHMPRDRNLILSITLLSLWIAFGSIKNGQTNLLMAAAMVHATVCYIEGKRNSVALWLGVALVAKPLAIVMWMLLIATDRKMVAPLLAILLMVLALPFLMSSPALAAQQYADLWQQLVQLAPSKEHRFGDINALLRTIGLGVPLNAQIVLALACAIACLALWIAARKRLKEPYRGLMLLALSTTYLMLLNPRTEGNSYVILVPVMAVLAARGLYLRQGALPILLAVMCVGLGNSAFGKEIWNLTKLWFKPVIALVFLGMLLARMRIGSPWRWSHALGATGQGGPPTNTRADS